jgi:hypothetical protein
LFSQTKRNNIQAQKVAFFTQKLELSPKEAEKFWPVYNEYQKERNTLNKAKRELALRYNKSSALMTDKEVSDALNQYMNYQKQETKLLEAYNEKFKQILPERKVMMIYIVEVQFKNHLLRQLKENR